MVPACIPRGIPRLTLDPCTGLLTGRQCDMRGSPAPRPCVHTACRLPLQRMLASFQGQGRCAQGEPILQALC